MTIWNPAWVKPTLSSPEIQCCRFEPKFNFKIIFSWRHRWPLQTCQHPSSLYLSNPCHPIQIQCCRCLLKNRLHDLIISISRNCLSRTLNLTCSSSMPTLPFYALKSIFRVRHLPSTCSSYFSAQPSVDKLHRIPANPVLPFTTKWFIIPLTVNALPILLLRITV